MAIKQEITGIAVFIVCSVQSAPTTEIDPGCKVTINQAHQYYSNPCGGLCLHLTRDSVMTQVSNMAGRANKEIASYLSQSRTFIFQQTSPELDHMNFPLFQKMDTNEETLKRTYVDLAIYFTFCLQVKQFEQDSNLQFSPPHFINYIDMTLLHIMRDIAAGLQDAHFVAQIPIVSRHCLSTELLRHQTKKQIIMKNLNSYFQSLRLFGLSA